MVDLAMKVTKATADIKTAATAPGLRRDAIGLREVLFQSITGMALGAPRARPLPRDPRRADRRRHAHPPEAAVWPELLPIYDVSARHEVTNLAIAEPILQRLGKTPRSGSSTSPTGRTTTAATSSSPRNWSASLAALRLIREAGRFGGPGQQGAAGGAGCADARHRGRRAVLTLAARGGRGHMHPDGPGGPGGRRRLAQRRSRRRDRLPPPDQPQPLTPRASNPRRAICGGCGRW